MVSGFGLGMLGMEQYVRYQGLSREEGAISLAMREQNNTILLAGMQWVTAEQELYIVGEEQSGEARIANAPESTLLASFAILRESDGAILYESEIIEPGQHIETIHPKQRLSKGTYGCTGIWSFYDLETEEYIGEAAMKLTVIVMDRGE